MLKNKRFHGGFTLVELLVVVAIIGILMGLVFPAVQSVRSSARRASCLNNINQLALATKTFESTQERLPACDQGNGASFVTNLLSDLEQEFALDDLNSFTGSKSFTYSAWLDHLRILSSTRIPTLICPSALDEENSDVAEHGAQNSFANHYLGTLGPAGTATYSDAVGTYSYTYDVLTRGGSQPARGSVSLEGLFAPSDDGEFSLKNSLNSAKIRDGSSFTVLYGEVSQTRVTAGVRGGWAFGVKYDVNGSDLFPRLVYAAKTIGDNSRINNSDGLTSRQANEISYSSNHGTGTHFAMLDGSARFINEDVDHSILRTLFSANGSANDGLEKPVEFE